MVKSPPTVASAVILVGIDAPEHYLHGEHLLCFIYIIVTFQLVSERVHPNVAPEFTIHSGYATYRMESDND